MNVSGFRVASALAGAWDRARIHDEFKGTTHCIEATKIGLEVLREFGVAARPLPCGIAVANLRAAELMDARVPVADWPANAWSVGVDPDVVNGNGVGWDGHLIIAGDCWLCDLAGEQFARPPLITITAWASPIRSNVFDDGVRHRVTDGKVRVDVHPRLRLARWRNGSAWRAPVPSDWYDQLVTFTRQILDRIPATQQGESR